MTQIIKRTLPANYNNLSRSERREVREQYVEQQEGLCCFCGAPLDDDPQYDVLTAEVTASLYPPGFFKHPVHLHHNHKTGMTIGAVHARCNAVLWEYYGE